MHLEKALLQYKIGVSILLNQQRHYFYLIFVIL